VPNVIEYLKQFRNKPDENLESNSPDLEITRFLSLTAKEFSRESAAILIKSYLLGENIWLISNPSCLPQIDHKYVAYLPQEFEALCKLSPSSMKQVHWLKKLVEGEIL
jgi:hypothetical protein